RDARIVALGTQPALAAHELPTPLATIPTTAHQRAAEFANDPEIGDDCRLLERQAQACKQILTQLAARAQDTPPVAQPLDAWLNAVIERWQVLRPDARITVQRPADDRDFSAPDGLEQAILNVLNNAADATPEAVELSADTTTDALVIDIADRGPGFTPEQKAQAGRVLFSGKPGRGWGMGLALTHATLERVGGSLTLTERDGGGTRVRIRLPWSPSE
ncbi:MAG: HAMP domain-containing histidine kinase, partial [Thiobacillus sp.]|nr:HAMP domain-containing histidine kinase [Thiobacillus sp.]